jgi:hypothetical protein
MYQKFLRFDYLQCCIFNALFALAVDWEVLEPSSSVLQTDAIPSQLPVRFLLKCVHVVIASRRVCARFVKRKNPVLLLGNTGFANVLGR